MKRRGYTLIELLTTILIVVILVAVIAVYYVKLLRIQEKEREEAYIREKLVNICGVCADYLSVGSSFHISTNSVNQMFAVKYRQETGGVSLETGRVARVSYLTGYVNTPSEKFKEDDDSTGNGTINFDVYSMGVDGIKKTLSNTANGSAQLIPLFGDLVSCTITPLNYTQKCVGTNGYETTDAALAWLHVSAEYVIENEDGGFDKKTVGVGRVVRLWNSE